MSQSFSAQKKILKQYQAFSNLGSTHNNSILLKKFKSPLSDDSEDLIKAYWKTYRDKIRVYKSPDTNPNEVSIQYQSDNCYGLRKKNFIKTPNPFIPSKRRLSELTEVAETAHLTKNNTPNCKSPVNND